MANSGRNRRECILLLWAIPLLSFLFQIVARWHHHPLVPLCHTIANRWCTKRFDWFWSTSCLLLPFSPWLKEVVTMSTVHHGRHPVPTTAPTEHQRYSVRSPVPSTALFTKHLSPFHYGPIMQFIRLKEGKVKCSAEFNHNDNMKCNTAPLIPFTLMKLLHLHFKWSRLGSRC